MKPKKNTVWQGHTFDRAHMAVADPQILEFDANSDNCGRVGKDDWRTRAGQSLSQRGAHVPEAQRTPQWMVLHLSGTMGRRYVE